MVYLCMTITVARKCSMINAKRAVQRDAMVLLPTIWIKPATTRPPLLLEIASLSLGHPSTTVEALVLAKRHILHSG